MRVDFTKSAHQVMKDDPASVFITGDLGYAALEGIAGEFPKRFLNAGVAEQNMMSVAAGIAMSGYKPWVYSIAPFATYRCLEQIRNDVCLHHLPVRIVGNGGGYTYGVLGSTHHTLEDFAALKALPGMTLFFPCTNNHVSAAVAWMKELSGPSYLRLAISGASANDEPLKENPKTLTRQYSNGDKLTVIGVGHAAQIALTAKAKLGLDTKNVDIFGIAKFPFDLESDAALVGSVKKTGKVLVIEEHYQPGGMAESLYAALAALAPIRSFTFMCAKYMQGQKYGSPAFHLKQSRISPEDLMANVGELLA